MTLYVVIHTGSKEEYLGCVGFSSENEAKCYIDDHHNLMIANIEREFTLKERLKLAPNYFPYAGLVQSMKLEVISSDLEP